MGDWVIVAPIGAGGMASVYVARSTGSGFGRLAAIKVMHAHLSSDESFVDMFLDEARVAATIHHANVVPVIDVGFEDGLVFLVMDYIEGDSFSNVETLAISLRRRIPLGITLRVVLDALAGLHAAHELRGLDGQYLEVVHRDVSPQNIVAGVDGVSRIVDFGIARAASLVTTTRVGTIKGKLNFMAPEQLRSALVDRRVDVFGMGVTLWEAVTLRRLYAGDNDYDTARRILTGEYPSLLDFDARLPPALDEICKKALHPNPDQRFMSAHEFADAIETHLAGSVASGRDVAAFISGVASQKLDRERRSIRDALPAGTSPRVPQLPTSRLAPPESSDDDFEETYIERLSKTALTGMRMGEIEATDAGAVASFRRAVRAGVIADIEDHPTDAMEAHERAAWETVQAIIRCLVGRLTRLRALRLSELRLLLSSRDGRARPAFGLRRLISFLDGGEPPTLTAIATWFADPPHVSELLGRDLRTSLGVPRGIETDLAAAGVIRNFLAHREEYAAEEREIPKLARPWMTVIEVPEGRSIIVRPETQPWLEWLGACILKRTLLPRPERPPGTALVSSHAGGTQASDEHDS